MPEPNEFPPPPFTPAPLELSERSGCRKALLFGCGGLFLIFALGLVGMVVKAPAILSAMLGYLEQDYTAKLAPDVPAEDRQRLHRAFEAARARPMDMKDPVALQAFQTKVMDLSAKTQLTREDAAGLCSVLEKLAGIAPPPGVKAPGPAPGPAPAPAPGPQAPTPEAPHSPARSEGAASATA